MDTGTFDRFRSLIYNQSGIKLGPGKVSLLQARVAKRMRSLGLERYEDYLDQVEHDASGDELVQLLDAISTNVTSFYREPKHFDFLAQAVVSWRESGQRRFRFWCAAASTGEEPYTILITLAEAGILSQAYDTRLLATDINTKVLDQCRLATYKPDRVEPVARALRRRYLRENPDGTSTVAPELVERALFKRLNLATPPFPMRGPLDAVFCRNVMIYFDNPTRQRLLGEIHRLLRPGGYLFVGHAESLTGLVSNFRSVQPAVYVRSA